ncbi:hypothetical protein ACRN94_22095, partial [Shewanella baltica]|uniref:hypothetical protein n=1 Tax=Shewanella baltica TaxID=62322 RepID=UPI003D7A6BAF
GANGHGSNDEPMGTILFFNGLAVSEGYCPFNLARQNLSLRQNQKKLPQQKIELIIFSTIKPY